MNCREYNDRWNELLDARSSARPGLERVLEGHTATCVRCRGVSARYQVLRQSLLALRSPVPSADSIERLYSLTVPSSPMVITRPSRRLGLRRLTGLVVAAGIFAVTWLGGPPVPRESPIGPSNLTTSSTSIRSSNALARALARATAATLELALEASAPVSRISREMLDFEKVQGIDLAGSLTGESAAEPEITDRPGPASPALFRSVGERFSAGVKPISGSARHAFGFLIGPLPDLQPASTNRRGGL